MAAHNIYIYIYFFFASESTSLNLSKRPSLKNRCHSTRISQGNNNNNNNNNTLFLKNSCHASLNAFYKYRLKHKVKKLKIFINLKIYKFGNQKANLKR